ncbi:MAG: DMT family transporter, partial [Pseudomonadota bacterium]
MTTQSKTSVPHGHALCLLSMLLFAAGFPAAEVLLATWGPIALITVRIIACCALMVTIWWAFEGFSAMRKAPWLRGGVIGALGFGTGTILILVAQDMTDAVTAALVAASMPVSAVALEVALDGRRLNKYFVGGLALVLTGGFIATGADLGDARFGLGAALGLLATVLFTWGSRAAVKNLPTSTGLAQATVTMIGAMLFCVA